MQALLFITMCRIAGVPARWQSGLYAEPGSVGMHDAEYSDGGLMDGGGFDTDHQLLSYEEIPLK